MLQTEVEEEYGLQGEYLVEYSQLYAEAYNDILERIPDSNQVKNELLYLYKNSSISRYIISKIPESELEGVLENRAHEFANDWVAIGGLELNIEDMSTLQLVSEWELIYFILAVYVGEAKGDEYIKPVEEILYGLMENIHLNNTVQSNTTIH